jgi:hypothetical protein
MAKLLKFVKEVFVDSDSEEPSNTKAKSEEKGSLGGTESDVTTSPLLADNVLRRTSKGEPTSGSRADADHIKVSPDIVPRTKMSLPDGPSLLYRERRSASSSSSSGSDSGSPRRTVKISVADGDGVHAAEHGPLEKPSSSSVDENDKVQTIDSGSQGASSEKAFSPPPRKNSTSHLPRKPSIGTARPKPPTAAEATIDNSMHKDARGSDTNSHINQLGQSVGSISSKVVAASGTSTSTPTMSRTERTAAPDAKQLSALGSTDRPGASDTNPLTALSPPTSRLGEVRMPSELIGGIGPYASIVAQPYEPKGSDKESFHVANTQSMHSNPGFKTSYMQMRAQSGTIHQRSTAWNAIHPLSTISEIASEQTPRRKLSYVEQRKARIESNSSYKTADEQPVRKSSYAERRRVAQANGQSAQDVKPLEQAEPEMLDIRRKQSYSERRKAGLNKPSDPASTQQDSPVIRKGSYAEVRKRAQEPQIRSSRLQSHDVNLETTTQARKYRPEIVQVVRKSTYVRKSASSRKENEPDKADPEDVSPVRKPSLSYGEKRRAKWPNQFGSIQEERSEVLSARNSDVNTSSDACLRTTANPDGHDAGTHLMQSSPITCAQSIKQGTNMAALD